MNEFGKFIVVCGTEGSGKTTAVKRLMSSDLKDSFVDSREPGGSKGGEDIRKFIFANPDLHTEARFHLFWAARKDHWNTLILPALKSGKHVICDRFDCCTYAFQCYGEEHVHLQNIFRTIREDMFPSWKVEWRPQYIHFDLPPLVGLGRKIADGDRNFFDDEQLAFHERVRRGYEEFGKLFPVKRLNADQDPEMVWRDFRTNVEKILV
ncbi:MAG: dTMP kinase [Parcubacteria group bacterium]|nr:dTMP kinase [Parcubacteria group bacterium]